VRTPGKGGPSHHPLLTSALERPFLPFLVFTIIPRTPKEVTSGEGSVGENAGQASLPGRAITGVSGEGGTGPPRG